MLKPTRPMRIGVQGNDLTGLVRLEQEEICLERNATLNPWQVLMLEMCLHRTRAEQVDRVAEKLITHGATASEFLDNIEVLEPELDTLGLRWRADNLMAAAAHIRDELEGAGSR